MTNSRARGGANRGYLNKDKLTFNGSPEGQSKGA